MGLGKSILGLELEGVLRNLEIILYCIFRYVVTKISTVLYDLSYEVCRGG